MSCHTNSQDADQIKTTSGPKTTLPLHTDKECTHVDLVVSQFKIQVVHLADAIMDATKSYVDARMCLGASSKLRDAYDYNYPGWRNEPRAQGLLQRMSDLEALEEQLKKTKEYIRATKTMLISLYQQIYKTHMQISIHSNNCSTEYPNILTVKAKYDDMMKEVNDKMVHVMAAMELILQADQQEDDAENTETS